MTKKDKPKKDKRVELLEKGAQIIYQKGFNNTGINEILAASGVPKGSFYFYFKNKEDYGLQLIDHFLIRFLDTADQCMTTPGISYLERFRNFFDGFLAFFESMDYTGGCPIGNFSLEMSDLNENFREKLNASFEKMKEKLIGFLENAQNGGELDPVLDIGEMADFILNGWEGALMRLKVAKNSAQMHLFYKIVFDTLLKKRTTA